MDGNSFTITHDEFQQIGRVKTGMVFIKSCNSMVNISSVSSIIPEENIKNKNQQYGVLHDGTKVRMHYGSWILDDGFIPDDRGNYNPVRLSRTYYPEIALDKVFSTEQYEKIKHLPLEERKKLVCGEQLARLESKPTSIKEISEKLGYEVEIINK